MPDFKKYFVNTNGNAEKYNYKENQYIIDNLLNQIEADVDICGSISNSQKIKYNNGNIHKFLKFRYEKDKINKTKGREYILQ